MSSGYNQTVNIMTKLDYTSKANELNKRFKSLNAEVRNSPYGDRLEIEVATVEKAKLCNEMFPSYVFTSGAYK